MSDGKRWKRQRECACGKPLRDAVACENDGKKIIKDGDCVLGHVLADRAKIYTVENHLLIEESEWYEKFSREQYNPLFTSNWEGLASFYSWMSKFECFECGGQMGDIVIARVNDGGAVGPASKRRLLVECVDCGWLLNMLLINPSVMANTDAHGLVKMDEH